MREKQVKEHTGASKVLSRQKKEHRQGMRAGDKTWYPSISQLWFCKSPVSSVL